MRTALRRLVCGCPLLKESRLNHLGKLAFGWLYWHVLLPGREIPGIPWLCRSTHRFGLPARLDVEQHGDLGLGIAL